MKKLKNYINEVTITDESIATKIDEYVALTKKMVAETNQLAKTKKEIGDAAIELEPTLRLLAEKVESSVVTAKSILELKKAGYSRMNPSYKEAFVTALSKVNPATRKVLENILKLSVTTTKIAATFKSNSLTEMNMSDIKRFFGSIFNKLKASFTSWTQHNKTLDIVIKKISK